MMLGSPVSVSAETRSRWICVAGTPGAPGRAGQSPMTLRTR